MLGFLSFHDDQAFKAREIARRLELDDGSVSIALTRLKERDLVVIKGTSWAITTEETRLRSHDGYARATASFNEQLGEEDKDAWATQAPEEPHPSLSKDEQ